MYWKPALLGVVCFLAQTGGKACAAVAWPTAQIQYSWPLRLGGEIGVNFNRSSDFWEMAGPFISVSGGRDGLGLNVGHKEFLPFLAPIAAGTGPSALYLWDDGGSTFVGARASISIMLVSVSSGAYRRVSGDLHDDWLFSLGVGAGFP
ncbi:MAG: hypothetical protein QUS11_04455 [Candidatus Fermentibacter sp.]|nr:hypothetical protein [Candidatus Fermentibacter sp.]